MFEYHQQTEEVKVDEMRGAKTPLKEDEEKETTAKWISLADELNAIDDCL